MLAAGSRDVLAERTSCLVFVVDSTGNATVAITARKPTLALHQRESRTTEKGGVYRRNRLGDTL